MATHGSPESMEIQLHFCQRCGISIPVADVASGRAHPAPGGYVCASCRIVPDEVAAAPPGGARAGRSGPWPLTLALLYLVGATSFLLYREATRDAPRFELPPVASPGSVAALDARLRELRDQTSKAVEALDAALRAHREEIEAARAEVGEVARDLRRGEAASLGRDEQILSAVDALARRTGITRSDVAEEIAAQMERLRRELAERGAGGGAAAQAPPPAPPPADPKVAEQERLVREYVVKLQSKDLPELQRYTAAVRLGELKHAAAVEPLAKALESDSAELVQRGAAWALGALGRKSVAAIPALIRQIGGKREWVAYMCDRALGDISQDALAARASFGFDPQMTQRERQAVQKKWEEWYAKNRDVMGAGGA
jgi:hypothetical protein